MCFSAALLALAAATLSCVHGPCDPWVSLWGCRLRPVQQDPNVQCPNFYETLPIEITADGGGIFEFDDLPVQALQVATEDYFQGPRPLGKPCSYPKDAFTYRRDAYTYRLVRQGDIVFVKIVADPDKCGRHGLSDEGATYAIGPDGEILHRHMGASLLDDYEPDGGVGTGIDIADRRFQRHTGFAVCGVSLTPCSRWRACCGRGSQPGCRNPAVALGQGWPERAMRGYSAQNGLRRREARSPTAVSRAA